MKAAYLLAAIPEPFVILGRRLRPFSLGHELLLQRFGSTFAASSLQAGNPVQFEDIILTVFVCAHSFEDAQKALMSPWLSLRLKLWGWRISLRGMDILQTVSLLREYIQSATRVPEYWLEELPAKAKAMQTGSPFLQHLKITLMANLHMSESDALNMAYGGAVWNYLTYWESQGRVQLMTEQEEALIEQANK